MDRNQLAEHFYIHGDAMENAIVTLTAKQAQETEAMKAMLDTYAPLMKALEPKAAAAYFGGWVSSLALCVQYALSLENKAVDLSPDNLTIQLYCKNEQHWYFAFVVKAWTEAAGPEDVDKRAEWRAQVLTRFYSETMRPLLEAAAQAGGLEVGQLWGQLPTKFNYYLEQFSEAAPACTIKERIADDYRFLKEEFASAVFGRKKNPFDVNIRYIPDWRDESKQVRQKNVCCLYYLTEDGHYCYTCPRMKESERAVRAEQFRSEHAQ